MVKVVITQDESIGEAIDQALVWIDDIEGLVRGRKVGVKPNDTWASSDDKSVITQPDTLRAVIRHLKKYDPSELVVSGGSGAGKTDEIFRVGGLMEIVEEEGGVFLRP